MNPITIYVKFVPSRMSDHWIADEDDLEVELTRIMPDVSHYSVRGFTTYKSYSIQEIFRCYSTDLPAEYDGITCMVLNVIPRNL